jgi:hypothetical protein
MSSLFFMTVIQGKCDKIYRAFAIGTMMILIGRYASAQTLIIQGDVVNIRSVASTSASIVAKAKRLEELSVIFQSKREVVNGVEDYWYNVQNAAGQKGFVFGHFTSLKEQGRQTQTLTFDGIAVGDCYHIMFGDLDFGSGINQLGSYESILEDEDNPNPRYVGRKFRVTYNNLYTLQSDYCNPELPEHFVEVPTILKLELAE